MFSDKPTSAVSTIRCGFPCSHVLRVTNELQLDMIKIQHWKIYAAHYNNDSSGIGMELKRIQLAYRHYEGMGVPISGDLLSDQGNLILMVSSHTYMMGLLRRIIIWLCQWKCQIALSHFPNFSHPNTTKITTK
jgi:hypothetical protein